MTVADNYDIEKQETNGTTKIFSFNFYTASKDFVKVILEVDGEQSIVPTTDYTIKLNAVGGTVTFTRAPASGGYIIITRETPHEQETSFATSSGFPAKTVEGRFDKLTAMIQEMQDTDNRTPSFPVGTDLNVTLPLPEAGKALIWNEDEDNLENSQTTFDEIVSDAISAKDDAVAAKEAAELAKGQSEQARDDAQAAQGYAESAKTAAEYAQSQAENTVAGFDDHADSKIGEVNTLVGQAEGYATVAENKANAAADSASDASGYKTDAQTAAGSASTSATNASVWAEGTDEEVEALGGEHSAKEWNSILSSSIGDATLTIQRNGEQLATFTANSSTDTTVNIYVPTTPEEINALPATTKYGASLSLSINSTTYVMTAQLKDQDGNSLGNPQTVDLPIESMVISAEYDADTKEIVLTLQSGSTTRFSVADLVSGLQTEITLQNKLDSDLVDDTNQTNKFVTSAEKTAWNGKQDAISDLATIRSGAAAGATAIQPSDLGTAAYEDAGSFATAAQGAKADTAVQPADLDTALSTKIDKGYAVNDFATNCITEIPQDINLTLSNGTLTLKAGSVITFPYGTQYSVGQDRTTTFTTNGQWIVVATNLGVLAICNYPATSGATDPSSPTGRDLFFNTTELTCKRWNSNMWENRSFPIAIITVSNGAISSIDKVFNGAGYIGHHAFVLPDVKVLIPDGFNSDGTLKGIIERTRALQIAEMTGPFADGYVRSFYIGFGGGIAKHNYKEIDDISQLDGTSNYSYVRNSNIVYTTQSGSPKTVQRCTIIGFALSGTTVTKFDVRPVSGLSGSYINQSLGLTASKAIVTDSSGNLSTSTTTNTELGYLAGTTSSVQTQLNSKVDKVTTATGFAQAYTKNANGTQEMMNIVAGAFSSYSIAARTGTGTIYTATPTNDGEATNKSYVDTGLSTKVETKPDGATELITNNKIADAYLPDYLLGQMIYAGGFVPATATATLTTNAKTKLGTQSNTIILTNDTTAITGYKANEGCYYICTADGSFAGISLLTGDWLVSTGSEWTKVDNTDAVTGVKGNAETNYRLGNVNITIDNVAPDQASNSGKFLTTNGTNATWGTLPVADVTVNGTSVVSNGTAAISNMVTTDTAQDITAIKTFKAQQRIQSGDPAGCLILGADVNATTLTDGTRKLGRVVFPTNEDTTLNCTFVSCDTQGISQEQTIQNCAEFGGRPGDRTATSPDIINFTVATEHNTTDNTKKKVALSIDKDSANFTSEPQYNGSPLVTTDTQQTIPVKKIFQTTVWNGGLTAKRSGTGGSYILFSNTGGDLGVIGVHQNEIPLFIDKNNTDPRAVVRAGVYLSSTGNDASVGNATTPVYIGSDGIAQECTGVETKTAVVALADSSTITLASNTIYNGGTLTALTIQLPSGVDNAFTSEIDFTSSTSPTTLSYPNTLKWIEGDDVASQVFTPAANKRYICMVIYDGTQFVGTVRGVE